MVDMIDEDDQLTDLVAELLSEPTQEVWRRIQDHPQAELLIELLEKRGFMEEGL